MKVKIPDYLGNIDEIRNRDILLGDLWARRSVSNPVSGVSISMLERSSPIFGYAYNIYGVTLCGILVLCVGWKS